MSGIGIDGVNSAAVLEAVKSGRRWRNMGVRVAFGYIDGAVSQWPDSAWQELATVANVQAVRITTTGQVGVADVADVEKGDMNPPHAGPWAAAERGRGNHYPVLYCDRSNKPAVIASCANSGLHRGTDYGLWIATLDGTFDDLDGTDLRAQPGVVAVQYDPAGRSGGDYDVSVIVGTWMLPGHAPAPWQVAADQQAGALAATLTTAAQQAGDLHKLIQANQ